MAPAIPEEKVSRLAGEGGIPRALAGLLLARGLNGPADIRAFLAPRLEDLSPPTGLPGLAEAVNRIARALAKHEAIFIHGDYDVDGLSATALLLRFLGRRGARVTSYIPHRMAEGYGLSEAGIESCRACGATLLITVDCGTRSHHEVELARSLGIECVVTDHHEVGRALPQAVAVVNPGREGSDPRHGDLAGVGVVLRLVQALASERGESPESWQEDLDLVALGTIADVVRLLGDNRILAREGLLQLAETRKPGLRALMQVSGLKGGGLGAWHVGFVLGPRLNAAGRLGMAERGLRLILSEDPPECRALAEELDRENQLRQKIDQEILREAIEKVELEINLDDTWTIVLGSPRWHRGVVGIVASRLVERYGRPVILLALEGSQGRGSGRSIPGFDLASALAEVGDLLLSHGGHPMAVGLSLETEAIPRLRERLNALAGERIARADLERRLQLDGEIALAEVNAELVRWLAQLEPHGLGNARPLFAARRVEIASSPTLVKQSHLRLRLRQDGVETGAIGFGMGERLRELQAAGPVVDLAFEVAEDRWRGGGMPEVVVRDFFPAGDPRGVRRS